jgi:methylmalonyl-CoA/ethylmalonyl-CoA epimerase
MISGESGVAPVMGIDHVGVAVRDADAASAHFMNRFGLEQIHDEILPNIGVRLVYLGVAGSAGTMIQLVQPVAASPIRDFLDTCGEGLHHVCFLIDDVVGSLRRLDGESATRVFVGGRLRRTCFLSTKANGVLVEFTERGPLSQPASGQDYLGSVS